MHADEAAELAAVRRDEVQGALQALLAVRLTDAPEADAAQAREAVRLAVAAGQPVAGPIGGRYAERLSEYLDERVCALVAKLEGRVGFAGLAQVRAEVGTTANGEKLYAFTHRTFMEYFAAGHLAATSDTPEQLALVLAPHIGAGEWASVGELAMQIKQAGTDRAVDRMYATQLGRRGSYADRFQSLTFLAAVVSSTRPSPATVRALTRAALDDALASELRAGAGVLRILIGRAPAYESYIYDEMSGRVGEMAASGDRIVQAPALRFVVEMATGFRHSPCRPWVDEQVGRHGAMIVDIAARNAGFRRSAVSVDVISVEQALTMSGDLSVLFGDWELVAAYQAKLTADEETLMRALRPSGAFSRSTSSCPG